MTYPQILKFSTAERWITGAGLWILGDKTRKRRKNAAPAVEKSGDRLSRRWKSESRAGEKRKALPKGRAERALEGPKAPQGLKA